MIFYAVPYDKLVAPVCPEAKLRKLVKNMIYVGVVAQLLDIDMAEVEKAIRKQFAKKVKAANLNLAAVQAGFDYASANLTKRDPFVIQRDGQDRRARSSSTATPPPRWDACSPASPCCDAGIRLRRRRRCRKH